MHITGKLISLHLDHNSKAVYIIQNQKESEAMRRANERANTSENINFHALYSIKLDKLCHCTATNESVLMMVQLTTRTHQPYQLSETLKQNTHSKCFAFEATSTSGERQFCLILSTFIFVFITTNSKYLPIYFKMNANQTLNSHSFILYILTYK